MTVTTARRTTLPAMPRPARTALLTVHVAVSVAWLGVESFLLLLAVVGVATESPETLRAAYLVVGLVGPRLVPVLTVVTLLSGVLLGLGTVWGLVRYWWVLAKLVFVVVLLVVGITVISHSLESAAAAVSGVPRANLDGQLLGDLRFRLLGELGVATLLLLTATTLSVAKPFGRTPAGRRALPVRSGPAARGG